MVVKGSLLERVFYALLWVLVVVSIFFAVMSFVEARLIINGQVYNANDSLQYQLNVFNVSLANEINARIANDSYLLSLINSNNLSNYYNRSQVDSLLGGKLNNSGADTFYGNLSVSGTGFFSYVGSSISRVAVGWFDWLYANNINATNITSTNIVASNLSGALNASNVVNAFWLPVYDQRYNDTVYIDLRLLAYYNVSQVDFLLDGKLNVSDQRYNDTLMIIAVNNSLANYLLVTDQRFNDTGFIVGLLSNYYNQSESDFLLDNKLNVSDQRYNDTLFILGELMNYYNVSEVDGLLSNYALNSSVLHNSGDQILFGSLLIYGNLSVVGSVVNLTVVNAIVNGSVIPEINGVFDLGSLSYYWNNVYANNVFANNICYSNGSGCIAVANGTNGVDGINGTNGVNGTSVTISNVVDNFDGTFTWQFSDGYNFTTSNLTGMQGIQGIQGVAGINGTNGINGINGTNGINGINGTNGIDGLNGTNGIDGVNGTSVFISNVVDNFDGTFTWQFSDGYNFTTSNLTGMQGIQGIAGINGTNGIDGVNGTNGIDGLNGTNGIDGVNGTNGVNGINGTNGIDGVNGTSVTFVNITENGGIFTWYFSDGFNFTTSNLTGLQGIQGVAGINGTNGIDGVNGTSVNISVVIDNFDGTFTWVFSNGYNFTTSNLTGLQGIQGVAGVNGTNGVNGSNAYNVTYNITNIFNETYNDSGLLGMINSINTTSNIASLGFNTTLQLQTLFYSILNPVGFLNASGVVSAVGNWSADKSSYNTTAQLNNWFLQISDQRYNDTGYCDMRLLNYYNMSQIDFFFSNLSDDDSMYALNSSLANYLLVNDQRYNESGLIKQPAGKYLYNDSQFFYVNESMLNLTINNISKVRVIYYNMTCTAVAGVCSVVSGVNISYEITEVKVIPTTITNNYKFQLTEYPLTTNIIDKDRASHVGVWDIEKSYAINGQVQANITNANINELFTISIIYLTNGVQ